MPQRAIEAESSSDDELRSMFCSAKVIAIAGLSDKPDRDSYRVASYLQNNGYTIVPVNPQISEALHQKSYASIKDIPFKIDIVTIFRKPEFVPTIVDEAIDVKAGMIWMQLGIVHAKAAEKALSSGIRVVMNRCIMVEHRRLQ